MSRLEKWRVVSLDPYNYGVVFERVEPDSVMRRVYTIWTHPEEYHKYTIGDLVDIEHTEAHKILGLSL